RDLSPGSRPARCRTDVESFGFRFRVRRARSATPDLFGAAEPRQSGVPRGPFPVLQMPQPIDHSVATTCHPVGRGPAHADASVGAAGSAVRRSTRLYPPDRVWLRPWNGAGNCELAAEPRWWFNQPVKSMQPVGLVNGGKELIEIERFFESN